MDAGRQNGTVTGLTRPLETNSMRRLYTCDIIPTIYQKGTKPQVEPAVHHFICLIYIDTGETDCLPTNNEKNHQKTHLQTRREKSQDSSIFYA